MHLVKKLLYVLPVCIILTVIFYSFARSTSVAAIPAILLQSFSFGIMIIAAYLLHKLFLWNDAMALCFSFVIAYMVMMVILWIINGGELFSTMKAVHTGRDFWGMLFPFVVTNLSLICQAFLKK